MKVLLPCPLCDYTLEAPALIPANRSVLLIVEKKLEAHLREHTLLEWLRAVTNLQTELN